MGTRDRHMASQIKRNPYEVLGVNPLSSDEDVKTAFRHLALKYHPDKDPEHKSKFLELTEAYDVLKTAAGRSAYNMSNGRVRSPRYRSKSPTPPPEAGEDIPPFMRKDTPPPFESKHEYSFGGMSEEKWQGFRVYPKPKERVGETLKCELWITFEEAFQGTKKVVKYNRMERCPICVGTGSSDLETTKCKKCFGTGKMMGDMYSPNPCTVCGGRGKIPNTCCLVCNGAGRRQVAAEEVITVKAGAYNNHSITRHGKGNELEVPGKSGDLIVSVKIKEHPNFKCTFAGLQTDLEVTYAESILGSEKLVPLLDEGKRARVRIEPGTENNTKLTLKGLGMTSMYDGERGPLVVNVKVVAPKNISYEELDLYKKILDLEKRRDA